MLAITACGRLNFEQRLPPDQPDAAPKDTCALTPSATTGNEFFVSVTGDDSNDGKSQATAWATFDRAWPKLQPGDTLTILDGTYRQQLRPTTSGDPSQPILIRALHDGRVVVDGEGVRAACRIAGASSTQRLHDLDLEGVRCINPADTSAGGETAVLLYHVDRVRVRRVSARASNDGVFGMFDTTNSVLEDVAAFGGGVLFGLSSNFNATVRRCYGRWTTGPTYYGAVVSIAGSDALVENCVAEAITPRSNYISGYIVSTNSTPANNNRFIANVARSLDGSFAATWGSGGDNVYSAGTLVRDSVAINSVYGVYQRGDAAMVTDRTTLNAQMAAFRVLPNPGTITPSRVGFRLTSSVLFGSPQGISYTNDPAITLTDHHDNVFGDIVTPYSGDASPGANEQMFIPNWNFSTFGDGAYLIRPNSLASAGTGGGPAGAEILYRTVDGALTTTPLWPWPLEDRILTEEGVSVTWESGGGLWRSRPPVSCP